MRLAIPVTVALMIAIGITAQAAEESAGPLKIKVGPYQQHVTQHSITIMWETNLPASSVVEYGPEAPLTQKVAGADGVRMHEVTIPDLPVESYLFYRVISAAGGERAESDIFPFKTAVKADTPFAFTVVGDSRWSTPETWTQIAAQCYAERPNLCFHVGDVVTRGQNYSEWIDQWLKPAAPLMSRVPMYVAIGDHEKNDKWFYYYVSYPSPENYYSFDYGNAHFVAVDSNQVMAGSPQYKWLEDDLRRSRAKWKIVFAHHPPYSSDNDDYGDTSKAQSTRGDKRAKDLPALFDKYNVDVVFLGHIHDYERTWPMRDGKVVASGGVVYIQTGGGGAYLEDFAPERSYFTAKVARRYEYCLVTVAGGKLRMMAYDIEGRLFDYLDLQK